MKELLRIEFDIIETTIVGVIVYQDESQKNQSVSSKNEMKFKASNNIVISSVSYPSIGNMGTELFIGGVSTGNDAMMIKHKCKSLAEARLLIIKYKKAIKEFNDMGGFGTIDKTLPIIELDVDSKWHYITRDRNDNIILFGNKGSIPTIDSNMKRVWHIEDVAPFTYVNGVFSDETLKHILEDGWNESLHIIKHKK